MNVVGIVSEYNPFHNGHAFQIDKAKKLSESRFAIAVMSGNFVQRGEPAIVNKHVRAKMALMNGIDLVLELPVCYATESAQLFSHSAVKMLDDSRVVTHLCFGSESGDIESLEHASKILLSETESFKRALLSELNLGKSFPMARQAALLSENTTISAKTLETPNNILSLEYLQSLSKLNSLIKPITIKRNIAGYHDLTLHDEISSASAIRNAVSEKNLVNAINSMPENCQKIFIDELENGNGASSFDNLSLILHYITKNNNIQWINEIQGIKEGFEHRIMSVCAKSFDISAVLKELKTKRFTQTAINRMVLHTILGLKQSSLIKQNKSGFVPYLRVLGFRRESAELLRHIQEKSTLPVITNVKYAENILDQRALSLFNEEIRTSDIYYLCGEHSKSRQKPKHFELSQPLVIV